MPQKSNFDRDAPATEPEDWVGAAKGFHRKGKHQASADAMTFYIFQTSNDSSAFAITDEDDTGKLPACASNGEWRLFKVVEETGQPRVGFSEADAKTGIEENGYFLTRVEVATRESVA